MPAAGRSTTTPNIIHFYGERGLIDSLFLDLQAGGKLAAFLNQVEFPFRDPPRLGLPEDAEVVVIVEAGFGKNDIGFGWPDRLGAVEDRGPVAGRQDACRLLDQGRRGLPPRRPEPEPVSR